MNGGTFNPLASSHWHLACAWRPRVHDGVRLTRLWSRGRRWHVLRDEATGQSCRLNAAAYEIAARLDGRRTLDELWAGLEARFERCGHGHAPAEEPPTQDEILAVVRELLRHGLLTVEGQGAASLPTEDHNRPAPAARPATARGTRNSVLAWRVPLIDPSRLLQRLQRLAAALFSRAGAAAWGLLMAALAAGLVLHGPALAAHGHAWMGTPRYLLAALMVYPLIKAVHEMAHGLAVQRWSGSVREAGVTLMLLMPVPYMDASSAHGFPRRLHRALVSAAGIMAELALATAGLWLWVLTEPGLLHDLGFVVWFTAGVSTLLFNANPLQRLDGYHLLTDALDLPNLAPRSRQWWLHAVRGWIGMAHTADQGLVTAPGERPWLVLYAPLAWAYQLALWTGLVWWLGGISAPLGWGLAVLAGAQLVAMPAWRWAGVLAEGWLWARREEGPGASGRRRIALLVAAPLLALVLPWPDGRVVQGVVWAPEEALIRADVDGFIETVHAHDGQAVQAGALLLTLHNPRLLAERDQVAAQLAQAEQDQYGQMGTDSGKAGRAAETVQQLQHRLARVQERLDALTLRARRDGRLILPREGDLPGRYVKRGNLLGHVVRDEPAIVRLAVDEVDAPTLLAHAPRALSARLSAPGGPTLQAALRRDAVGASRLLPSAALSQAMGGDVATEPSDTEHRRTVRPVVALDVAVTLPAGQAPLGERARVRFDRGWTPPLVQIGRWLARQMRLTFNPAR